MKLFGVYDWRHKLGAMNRTDRLRRAENLSPSKQCCSCWWVFKTCPAGCGFITCSARAHTSRLMTHFTFCPDTSARLIACRQQSAITGLSMCRIWRASEPNKASPQITNRSAASLRVSVGVSLSGCRPGGVSLPSLIETDRAAQRGKGNVAGEKPPPFCALIDAVLRQANWPTGNSENVPNIGSCFFG